jgi:hypothetical protein
LEIRWKLVGNPLGIRWKSNGIPTTEFSYRPESAKLKIGSITSFLIRTSGHFWNKRGLAPVLNYSPLERGTGAVLVSGHERGRS